MTSIRKTKKRFKRKFGCYNGVKMSNVVNGEGRITHKSLKKAIARFSAYCLTPAYRKEMEDIAAHLMLFGEYKLLI